MESDTRAAGPNGSNVAVVVLIARPAEDRSESVWPSIPNLGMQSPNPLTFGFIRRRTVSYRDTDRSKVGAL